MYISTCSLTGSRAVSGDVQVDEDTFVVLCNLSIKSATRSYLAFTPSALPQAFSRPSYPSSTNRNLTPSRILTLREILQSLLSYPSMDASLTDPFWLKFLVGLGRW